MRIRDGFGQTETTVQIANTPGQPVKPGSMGRPMPGYPVVLVDPATGRAGVDEGEICLDLSQRPLGLMVGYHGDPERNAEAMAGGYYHTGDVGSRDADGLHHLRRPRRRRVQGLRLPDQPVRAGERAHRAPRRRRGGHRARPRTRCGWPCPRPTSRSPPAPAPTAEHRRVDPAALPGRTWPPTSGSAGWSSPTLPKTISGKIRRVDLRRREVELNSDPAARAPGEFRDDDFAGLRGAQPRTAR